MKFKSGDRVCIIGSKISPTCYIGETGVVIWATDSLVRVRLDIGANNTVYINDVEHSYKKKYQPTLF